MTRNYLINHLIEQECYPDEECDSTVSQLWHNAINGEACYIPYEDELVLTTYCHIICELRVNPPVEFDADYYVYTSFKKGKDCSQSIEEIGNYIQDIPEKDESKEIQ